MDRNLSGGHLVDLGQKSLSARRAWIEICTPRSAGPWQVVALRKESVDRNLMSSKARRISVSRSPQGERG